MTLRKLERFRPFLHSPGLTISGGEPLFQPQFTLALIRAAKAEGWHVALDTSGWGPEASFVAIADAADLVLLSIKHPLQPERVARQADQTLSNWRRLIALDVPVRLRYVLIPGWTDTPAALDMLGELARRTPRLERVEILPFNSLAADKWAKLGWDSPLFHGERSTVTEAQIHRAEQIVRQHLPKKAY